MCRSSTSVTLLICVLVVGCTADGPDLGMGPDGHEIPTECSISNSVTLEVGETREFRGTSARFFCLQAGEGGTEEFTLVLFEASESSRGYSALVPGSLRARGPPLPAPGATPPEEASPAWPEPDQPDDGFHLLLRDREARELAPLLEVGPAPEVVPRSPRAPPTVGQIVTYNAQANPDDIPNGACEVPLPVQARIEAVSQRAIVAADLQNPAGGFTTADYQAFAAEFDTLIAPVAETHFGTTTNVGGTGRVILLFTREVNRLTARDASSFTAGFFFARDLFPRTGNARLRGCAHSNEAEILYLMVPDPGGTIHGNPRSRTYVLGFTPSTIIHEYQHLINASRRLHVRQLTGEWSEAPWLNEGLSHLAEELLFYAASGLAPRQNVSGATLGSSTSPRTTALNRHQRFNFNRFFRDFLPAPETSSPFATTVSLGSRGAAWHFLRYLADRWGGDDPALLRSLVDTSTRGLDNLAAAVGGRDALFDWMADWRVALYADERVPNLDPRHRDLSWHLPSLHFLSGQPLGTSYPILTHRVEPGRPHTGELTGGGAAYLRFGLPSGFTSPVEVTSGGGLPPTSLRAILIRTR